MNIDIVLLVSIVVLILQIRGETETPRQKFNRIRRECQADPSTQIDDVTISRHAENIENPRLGKFLLCLNVGMGVQNGDGTTPTDLQDVLERVLSEPEPARLKTFMEACGTKKAGSPEQLAIELSRCINKYFPELNFLHDP